MPALGDVVSRFHGLLAQNSYQEAGWAENLQQRMREQGLTDSGRLLSPVLRPLFLTQKQVDGLAKTVSQLSAAFERLSALVLANSKWMNRLQMLPAEKSLLAVSPGYELFCLTGSVDLSLSASGWMVANVHTCRPIGLAHADALADLFCEMPVMKEFRHSGSPISKLIHLEGLTGPLLNGWRQFGGKGKPAVGIVDWADGFVEGELLADLLTRQGVTARFTPVEKLRTNGGDLHDKGGRIDLVLRRITTPDLLTRWELDHPLLEAYRSGAVCVVNSFRSEMGQRRCFLELLTDDTVTTHLPIADRKLLKEHVLWTRILSTRKVRRGEEEVDLVDFTLKNREKLSLLPNRPSPELRSYAGSEMTPAAWEWAVRQALRTSYVVQETGKAPLEPFPFFQYGEFKLRDVEVTLQAQFAGGKLAGCTALLCNRAAAGVTPLGIAPVLMVRT